MVARGDTLRALQTEGLRMRRPDGTLVLALWMPRVEAVLTATMLAWLAYAMAAGWAFYARTAWGAWGGTLLPALAMGACAMAPQWMRDTP